MIPMTKIEKIGNQTLILGDCLEVMPTLGKVDAVVTDPPYGVGFTGQTENDGRKSRGGYNSFDDTDHEYIMDRVRLAISTATRSAITPGSRLLPKYPPFDDLGCFFVPGGVGMGRWGFCCSHPIAYYGKRPSRPGMWPTSFYDAKPMPSDTGHPVAKPIAWMNRLVSIASMPGETILDPFMGSGTTLVACQKLGRHGIGIEIDPDYFKIACERVHKAWSEPDLFIDAAPKPEQTRLDL